MIFFRDPTLDELLGDPLTQAMMHADRVDPPALAAMLRTLAREISGRSGGTAAAPATAQGAHSAVGRLGRPIGAFKDAASRCVSGSSSQSRNCGAP
jgi:hypothetical protein